MSYSMPSNKRKGLMIILDGLGDRSCPALDGATPLEAAHTPNLDRVAGAGLCGLIDPIYPGMPVGTHTGTGVLMGLALRDAHQLSRGPVEAAGVGLLMQPGDVALRCNFATLRPDADGFAIQDRRAGRIRAGTDELCQTLSKVALGPTITATVHPATQHRAVLRLTGRGLSAAITDTDPGAGAEPMRVLNSHPRHAKDAAAAETAAAINEFTREAYARLSEHPVNRERIDRGLPAANGIITRGAGQIRKLTNLLQQRGLEVAVVAGERTVLGLGRLFDFTTISGAGFTALPDTDLSGKVEAARVALEAHDMVIVHIKGTDICSHDRDPRAKKSLLERIDRALAPLLTGELVIAVSGDHSTDCNTGCHCGDPVPSLLYSPAGRRDRCQQFGETECAAGGLGRVSATGLLLSMLDYMGCMQNFRRADRYFFVTDGA